MQDICMYVACIALALRLPYRPHVRILYIYFGMHVSMYPDWWQHQRDPQGYMGVLCMCLGGPQSRQSINQLSTERSVSGQSGYVLHYHL